MNTTYLPLVLEHLKLMLLIKKAGFPVPEAYETTLAYIKERIDIGDNTIDNPEPFITFIISEQIKISSQGNAD